MAKSVKFKFGLYQIICLLTSMVGYNIHNSIFWSIIDYLFMPFALFKWVICHQITLNIIKQTFSWFLQ